MALRKSLLPARRNRKPDQGVARDGNRPHQLQPLLGQPVPCAADCRSLRADAGTATERCWHQLRSGSSLDSTGALPETGGAGGRLGTAHGCALAAIVSASGDLPTYGAGAGSIAWVERHRSPPDIPIGMTETTTWESPVSNPLQRRDQLPIRLRSNLQPSKITPPLPLSAILHRAKRRTRCVHE